MDVFELKAEIEEYLKEVRSQNLEGEADFGSLHDALVDFADGHRAVIYGDLELFQNFDISSHQFDAIEMLNREGLSVCAILSLLIYSFIMECGLRILSDFELN